MYQAASDRQFLGLTEDESEDVGNGFEAGLGFEPASPGWLKINETTGLLTGVPDAIGKVEVAVTATIRREVRKLDEKTLAWGNEKVLSTAIEQVGAAIQNVTIDVR